MWGDFKMNPACFQVPPKTYEEPIITYQLALILPFLVFSKMFLPEYDHRQSVLYQLIQLFYSQRSKEIHPCV